jgi:hypothetical protein
MKIEHIKKGIRYTLSNENLKVGDKVYPIATGRCLENDEWILHDIGFKKYLTGFPGDPDTIIDLEHSKDKAIQVSTNRGYSPIEVYYKIIKKEKQVEDKHLLDNTLIFKNWKWVEIKEDDDI